MSYRELRDFTETLRSLGYPRIVSLENFRKPNFELVADILFWLLHRYDPNANIADEISTEHERVEFLKGIGEFLATHARIKLNLRRLYAGDGYAVKELLKVASLLDEATRIAATDATSTISNTGYGGTGGNLEEVNIKLLDVNGMREMSSSITHLGASIHEHLNNETSLRDQRHAALSRAMDRLAIERAVVSALKQTAASVESVHRVLESSRGDEQQLLSKIEKKKAELDRGEKRLATLKSVRPAYMDEYEDLCTTLQKMYGSYMERHRNLLFLENELEGHRMMEMDKMEEQSRVMKRMQKRLRDEELRILRGEQAVPGLRNGSKKGNGKNDFGYNKFHLAGDEGFDNDIDEDGGSDEVRERHSFENDVDIADDDNISISDDADYDYIDNDDDDDTMENVNNDDIGKHRPPGASGNRPSAGLLQRRRSSIVVEEPLKDNTNSNNNRRGSYVKGSMVGGDDFDELSDEISEDDDDVHSSEAASISINDGDSSDGLLGADIHESEADMSRSDFDDDDEGSTDIEF